MASIAYISVEGQVNAVERDKLHNSESPHIFSVSVDANRDAYKLMVASSLLRAHESTKMAL